jgi:phosphoglucosamine mutase
MGILFGTDGIRGVAGRHPLDPDTIHRTGWCLTRYLAERHGPPHILIARDTRISGPWIEALLRAAVERAGGIAEIAGVISTPAVSLITTSRKAHAGIMISASHNPYQDNGIKIFSSEGMKFGDEVENELEEAILRSTERPPEVPVRDETPAGRERFSAAPAFRDLYVDHLRRCLPRGFTLRGVRLVVDCAHGALFEIAPDFLRSLGAQVHAIHCEPDGCNINRQAGALHLERLQQEVRAGKGDLGIAFDGDADRAMFVDSGGSVRDGDDVLYLFARYLGVGNHPRTVVGTVMANLGLEIALAEQGIELVRTSVGDRYVLEEMLRRGAALGGEQSGHVILMRHARTGDGLLTALKVLEVLLREQKEIAELCRPVKRFPQILINVPVREKVPFEQIPGLQQAEAECRSLLGPRSRILLRYSGTEKLARIMVEGEREESVRQAAVRLAGFFGSFGDRLLNPETRRARGPELSSSFGVE